MIYSILQTIYEFSLIFYYWIEAILVSLIPCRFRYKDISGDIALITGAGSGLGRLLALRFAEKGAILVLWDIDDRGNAETAKMIQKLGGQATAYNVNVCDKESVYETAAKVKDEVGIVTILANNAGIVVGKSILQIPDNMVERSFQVNAISHFWLVKAFLPDMLIRDKGHILSVSSLAGLGGVPQLTDYCASKFAAVGFLESLSMELYQQGVKNIYTTLVCPYYINTGMFNGVHSKLFNMLEPDYVADMIISAVLSNKRLLLMPRIFYFLYMLKTILPSKSIFALHDACGSSDSMSAFTGRNTKID